MALPEALRLNKREREHQELVEFVNYLQANVAREGFFGKSLLPSLETLTALAEGMKRYDEDYGQKPVVKNETSVHRLTGWKSEGMQEVG